MDKIQKKTIKQFNKWAMKYDHNIWKKYFDLAYKKAITYLPENENLNILDLGCATGDLLFIINERKQNNNLYGYDISDEMLAAARVKFRDSNLVMLTQGDAYDLPYESNFFDFIFCLNSFHHYRDKNHILNEIDRVLKPGGIFILLDPFTDNILRKCWSLILKLIFMEFDVKYYTSKEIKNMFNSARLDFQTQDVFHYFTLFSIGKKKC